MKLNYDESGVTFFYFLIATLALVLVPITLIPLFSNKNAMEKDIRNSKKIKIKKSSSTAFNLKWITISLGWVLLSFLTYKVMTTEIVEEKLWDPYTILNIQEGSTLNQIKKHYRKLSLKFHPDKVHNTTVEEGEEANLKFVEITKAYKALTDDDIRKNYEEYGHPDGRQSTSLGIALPSWLVEAHNNFWVLSIYGAVLGLFLPFYVGKWWYRSLKYTRDQILNQTMAKYFKKLEDGMPMRDLIDLLATSSEFSQEVTYKPGDKEAVHKLWKLVKQEAEKSAVYVEEPRNNSSDTTNKAAALIQAHLHRVEVQDSSLAYDQQEIIARAVNLIHGLIQITISFNWIHQTMVCIELSQMLVQATNYKASPLTQLPGFDLSLVRHIKSKFTNIKTVLDLMKLEERTRRELLVDLSDKDYKRLVQIALKFPILKLVRCQAKVIGDTVITPEAIITCVVKLKLITIEQELQDTNTNHHEHHDEADENLVDDEDSHVRSFLSKASQSHLVPAAYAPYFPALKRANWWIMIGDLTNGRMVVNPSKVNDLVDETSLKFQFQGPPEAGDYSLNLFIRSDSYLGCDINETVEFTVHPDTELPEEPEVDDEISEPEEGSMASQMAQMRSGEADGEDGAAAPSGPVGDDYTSSEEE